MVDEDLRARSERAEAALHRVIELAHDMRTWCSPHGVALGYADRLAEAIVGAPGLQKPGETLAALADLDCALGQAGDKWRDLTVQTEQQFVHAQQLLGEVLARFTRHGHPGEPSMTTGWIPERVVTGWREQHLALWRGAPDTEPETAAPTVLLAEQSKIVADVCGCGQPVGRCELCDGPRCWHCHPWFQPPRVPCGNCLVCAGRIVGGDGECRAASWECDPTLHAVAAQDELGTGTERVRNGTDA